jgi:arabinogalactan endo-1,4-beta-galactosidase
MHRRVEWTLKFRTIALVAMIIPCAGCSQSQPFIKGVDLSILKEAEDHGVQFKFDGKATDAMEIFKQSGCNWVRLRLFVDPPGTEGQVNTLEYTLAMARRVKREHLKLLLDFHYSDRWADAEHQDLPSAWADLTHEQLVQRVHDYTAGTLKSFAAAQCLPDMVAIGNEISNGMMWPDGGPLTDQARWPALIELLKAGARAVREASTGKSIRIMIHLDKGGNPEISEAFFNRCQKSQVDFDVIGLSYYPFWQASLDDLQGNLIALSNKYNKDIAVAETDYNYCGEEGNLPYPCTPVGQKQFLEKLMKVVAATPGGHGIGVIYWEPAWIDGAKWNGPNWSTEWEQRALFDKDGNALPALSVFKSEP